MYQLSHVFVNFFSNVNVTQDTKNYTKLLRTSVINYKIQMTESALNLYLNSEIQVPGNMLYALLK